MNATDELLRSLSEKERRAVVAYGAQVCLRCDTVVNVLGESPMSAVRSYQLGAKLNWRQVAACAAAGASISEALDEAREEFEALLRAYMSTCGIDWHTAFLAECGAEIERRGIPVTSAGW